MPGETVHAETVQRNQRIYLRIVSRRQGRLTEPVRYDAATDRYLPISWDAAFALIADHLNHLESPDQAEFYTSGRASNEAAFLYQLFARAYGTNNFPDCSNMFQEAIGVALNGSL